MYLHIVCHSRAATVVEARYRISCKIKSRYSLILLVSATVFTGADFFFLTSTTITQYITDILHIYMRLHVWKAHACSSCVMYHVKWSKYNSNTSLYLLKKIIVFICTIAWNDDVESCAELAIFVQNVDAESHTVLNFQDKSHMFYDLFLVMFSSSKHCCNCISTWLVSKHLM